MNFLDPFYAVPYNPIYNHTKHELQLSILNLEEKLRRRKQIDLEMQNRMLHDLPHGYMPPPHPLTPYEYLPVAVPEFVHPLPEYVNSLSEYLPFNSEQQHYEQQRLHGDYMDKIQRLRRERDLLHRDSMQQEELLLDGQYGRGDGYIAYDTDQDTLIKKYEDGTRAREYYQDIQQANFKAQQQQRQYELHNTATFAHNNAENYGLGNQYLGQKNASSSNQKAKGFDRQNANFGISGQKNASLVPHEVDSHAHNNGSLTHKTASFSQNAGSFGHKTTNFTQKQDDQKQQQQPNQRSPYERFKFETQRKADTHQNTSDQKKNFKHVEDLQEKFTATHINMSEPKKLATTVSFKNADKSTYQKEVQNSFRQGSYNDENKKTFQSKIVQSKIDYEREIRKSPSNILGVKDKDNTVRNLYKVARNGQRPKSKSINNRSANKSDNYRSKDQKESSNIKSIEAEALKKIENRLKLSEITFEDSEFRNVKHEGNHLRNTYENQIKMRRQIREKINSHPDILRKHAMVINQK